MYSVIQHERHHNILQPIDPPLPPAAAAEEADAGAAHAEAAQANWVGSLEKQLQVRVAEVEMLQTKDAEHATAAAEWAADRMQLERQVAQLTQDEVARTANHRNVPEREQRREPPRSRTLDVAQTSVRRADITSGSDDELGPDRGQLYARAALSRAALCAKHH